MATGFSTNAHHDHLLWHPCFGDAPRWASAITCALVDEQRSALVEAWGDDWPGELLAPFGLVSPLVSDQILNPFGPDGPVEPDDLPSYPPQDLADS